MKHSDFSDNLKLLRERKALTQTQIAPIFGVKQGAYSAWEKGTREPDFTTLCNIAKYFNVSTDWLLGLDTGKAHNVNAHNSAVAIGGNASYKGGKDCSDCPILKAAAKKLNK